VSHLFHPANPFGSQASPLTVPGDSPLIPSNADQVLYSLAEPPRRPFSGTWPAVPEYLKILWTADNDLSDDAPVAVQQPVLRRALYTDARDRLDWSLFGVGLSQWRAEFTVDDNPVAPWSTRWSWTLEFDPEREPVFFLGDQLLFGRGTWRLLLNLIVPNSVQSWWWVWAGPELNPNAGQPPPPELPPPDEAASNYDRWVYSLGWAFSSGVLWDPFRKSRWRQLASRVNEPGNIGQWNASTLGEVFMEPFHP
jgi:hypothetical protein